MNERREASCPGTSTCTDTDASWVAASNPAFTCSYYASQGWCKVMERVNTKTGGWHSTGGSGPNWNPVWNWAIGSGGLDARDACCVCGGTGVKSSTLGACERGCAYFNGDKKPNVNFNGIAYYNPLFDKQSPLDACKSSCVRAVSPQMNRPQCNPAVWCPYACRKRGLRVCGWRGHYVRF